MIPAAFIIARIADTQGSTPRENGAYMLIAAEESLGSIGGGKLEQQVMEEARALLAETEIGEGDRRSPLQGTVFVGRPAVALFNSNVNSLSAQHWGNVAAGASTSATNTALTHSNGNTPMPSTPTNSQLCYLVQGMSGKHSRRYWQPSIAVCIGSIVARSSSPPNCPPMPKPILPPTLPA